jgi:hypothetical protein
LFVWDSLPFQQSAKLLDGLSIFFTEKQARFLSGA